MQARQSRLLRILALGENKLGEMLGTVMETDEVSGALERANRARIRVLDSMAGFRNMVGLPSYQDMQKLQNVLARSGRKLDDLRASLAELEANLEPLCGESLAAFLEQTEAEAAPAVTGKRAAVDASAKPRKPAKPKSKSVERKPAKLTADLKQPKKAAKPKAPRAAKAASRKPSKPSAVVSLTGQPLLKKSKTPAKPKSKAVPKKASRSTVGLTSIDIRKIKGR